MDVFRKVTTLASFLLILALTGAGAAKTKDAEALRAPIDYSELNKVALENPSIQTIPRERLPKFAWTVEKVVPFSSLGSQAKKFLIVLKSNLHTYIIGVFILRNKKLLLEKTLKFSGDWFSDLSLVPAGPAGKSWLVVYTLGGNHGAWTDIFIEKAGELQNVFSESTYENRGQVVGSKEKGYRVISTFAMNGFAECCLMIHSRRFSWNGEKFVEDDPFMRCFPGQASYGSYTGSENSKSALKQGRDCLADYLKSHPKDFLAAYNCARLSSALGDKAQGKRYWKQALAIGDDDVSCEECSPETIAANKVNRASLLQYKPLFQD